MCQTAAYLVVDCLFEAEGYAVFALLANAYDPASMDDEEKTLSGMN